MSQETGGIGKGAVVGGEGFTPGPWAFGRHGLRDFEVLGDGVQVAVLRGSFSRPVRGTLERSYEEVPVEEAWANAALIATAPDLLAALEMLVVAGAEARRELGRLGNRLNWDPPVAQSTADAMNALDNQYETGALHAAQQAIRKARGLDTTPTPESEVNPSPRSEGGL